MWVSSRGWWCQRKLVSPYGSLSMGCCVDYLCSQERELRAQGTYSPLKKSDLMFRVRKRIINKSTSRNIVKPSRILHQPLI